jgi:hypothetical protein
VVRKVIGSRCAGLALSSAVKNETARERERERERERRRM